MAKKQTFTMPTHLGPSDKSSELYIIGSLLQLDHKRDLIFAQGEDIISCGYLKEYFRTLKNLHEENKSFKLMEVLGELKRSKGARSVFESVLIERLGDDKPVSIEEIETEMRNVYISAFASVQDFGTSLEAVLDKLKSDLNARIAAKVSYIADHKSELDDESFLNLLTEQRELLEKSVSGNHASIFDNITEEDIFEEMKADHEGIATRYYVYDTPNNEEKERHEIRIPRGAITLVCGKPGHGKSTFLRNLALRLVAGEEEGEIIYLAYEESVKKIVPKFISLNFGDYIKTNGHREGGNIDRIRDYYKGEKGYITNLMAFEESFKIFKSWRTSGRFKVISPTHSSRDIVAALRAHIAKPGVKVAAVFVDYIQFMKSGRLIKEKRLDINEILNDFLGFAKETDIPVIAAAQLAKEAASPESMSDDNIAESADLGRYADMVLCLWNSRKKSHVKKDSNYLSEDPDSHYQKYLKKRDFDFEKGGHIYVKVCKARDIDSGADNVFTFNGNTGVVGEAPRSVWAVGDIPEEIFAEQPQSVSALSDEEFNRLRTQ